MAIEINGLEVALGRLDNLCDIPTVEQGIKDACLLIERAAKQKAPKGDGTLIQSITSKVDNLVGQIYTPLFYAPYVEYGTGLFSTSPEGGRKEVPWVYILGQHNENSKKTIYTEETANQTVAMLRADGIPAVKSYGQEPQPYLRPALDENREEVIRLLREALLND